MITPDSEGSEMVQANAGAPALSEKVNDPAEWSISQLITALVQRCEHAENTITALVDAMPSADELDDVAPQKWFDGLMEGRVYWEMYDGPSPLAFRLSDVGKLNFSNEAERADVRLNQPTSTPTDVRTTEKFWIEKRDGRYQLHMAHRGHGSNFCVAQINHWADNAGALANNIVTACNAYEPMREALENARALWGHRCLDAPQLTWLAQVDAALSTLPVNDRQTSDNVGRLRDLLQNLADAIVEERISRGAVEVSLEDRHRDRAAHRRLENAYISAQCATSEAVREARAALNSVPQPASDAGKISTDEVRE